MTTAMPNGKHVKQRSEMTPEEIVARTKQLRIANRLRRAEIEQHVLESFYPDSYADFGGSDQFEQVRNQTSGLWVPISQPSDRRGGANWPLWRNDFELGKMRQASRLLMKNSFAQAAVRNRCNYVINTGLTYTAEPADSRDAKRWGGEPDGAGETGLHKLTRAVQAWMDDFCRRVNLNTCAEPNEEDEDGAVPAASSTKEREAFWRVDRDGETFLRLTYMDDGKTECRFADPELIWGMPPGGSYDTGWSFGIQHRINPNGTHDESMIVGYYVRRHDVTSLSKVEYDADAGRDGDIVPAREILHIKNPWEDAEVKRGTPMFAYDAGDAFNRAGTLQRVMSIAASYRAATIETWKHNLGTKDQIQTLQNALPGARSVTGLDGTSRLEMSPPRPQIRRIPQSQEPVPNPTTTNIPEHQQAMQGDIRQGMASVCAPEYMGGSTNDANFATAREAGTPFVNAAEAEQSHWKMSFVKLLWRVVRHAVRCGKLPEEALRYVTIKAEMQSPKKDNEGEMAAVRTQNLQAKVTSPQIEMRKLKNDPAQVMRDWKEFEQATQGGQGDQAPGSDPDVDPRRSQAAKLAAQRRGLDVAESKDTSGHEHGDDGKFTSGSGGKHDWSDPKSTASKFNGLMNSIHQQLRDGDIDEKAASERIGAVLAKVVDATTIRTQKLLAEVKRHMTESGKASDYKFVREEVMDRLDAVHDALSERSLHPIQDADKETRSAQSAEVASALSKLQENFAWAKRRAGLSDVAESKDASGHEHRGKGRWITIGGKKGDDGKRNGGSPVYIENGRITKGHPSLTGKKLGSLDADADDGTHRQQLHKSREYGKAVWAKKARKEGIDAASLHQVAAEMKQYHESHVADVHSLLKDARQAASKLDVPIHHKQLSETGDHTKIPGFDILARNMANRYPHILGAHGYGHNEGADVDAEQASEKLLDLLKSGNPESMTDDEAYEQAYEYLVSQKDAGAAEESDADDSGVDDAGDFDFGANVKADKKDIISSHVRDAKKKLGSGGIKVSGHASSEPITSDASGEQIRRYVEMPNGARLHPDEVHRHNGDELGHEGITIKDPLNRGETTGKTFEHALRDVTAYRGRDDDPVTLQTQHGYMATKTRGEWRKVAEDHDGNESMSAWYDRENPSPISHAAHEYIGRVTKQPDVTDEETSAFFKAPAQVQSLYGWNTPALSMESAEWDEEEHPRDHGKFASNEGGSGQSNPTGDDSGGEKTSGGLAKLADIGKAALDLEHGAKEIVKHQFEKLPDKLRAPVAGFLKLFYGTYVVAQKAVDEVAKEQGISEEGRNRLASVVCAIDAAGMKANMVAGGALGGPAGATVASFVPVGSMSYLAFSAVKNPAAVLRAARTAVADYLKSLKGDVDTFTGNKNDAG